MIRVCTFDNAYVLVSTDHEGNGQLILSVERHEGVDCQITLEGEPVLGEGGELR